LAQHILQFFSMLGNGGAENRMMDVYRCLNNEEVVFDFAIFHDDDHEFDEEVISKGSKIYLLPDPRRGIIRCYLSMVHFFKAHNEFKAVHAHVSWFNGVVLMAAKKAGIPVRIAHARDSKYPDRSLKDSVFCNIGKILISLSATQRIAISKEAAENIFGKNTVKRNHYLFVPNSIDQKKYSILTSDEIKSIREKLRIPDQYRAFVTVANLREQKNHLFLLQIAKEIKKINPNFLLFLIGGGPLREIIESRILDLGLEENVILLGNRTDVPEILGAFDCMIFPSLFEGLGGVVLEAQLVGIPSVVSDRIPEIANVGAEMVTFLSLDKSAKEWAETAIHIADSFTYDLEKTQKAFKEKGFCIEDTAAAYLKEYGFKTEEIKEILK